MLWPAGQNWHFGVETGLFNFQCCYIIVQANEDENIKIAQLQTLFRRVKKL